MWINLQGFCPGANVSKICNKMSALVTVGICASGAGKRKVKWVKAGSKTHHFSKLFSRLRFNSKQSITF